jgi:hypothetical protein
MSVDDHEQAVISAELFQNQEGEISRKWCSVAFLALGLSFVDPDVPIFLDIEFISSDEDAAVLIGLEISRFAVVVIEPSSGFAEIIDLSLFGLLDSDEIGK